MQIPEQFQDKLARYYNDEQKLVQYPSKRPLRILALTAIGAMFCTNTAYTEKEVNAKIQESIAFADVELIRREMFQYRILGRERDGSRYWLEENWLAAYETL